MHDIEPYYKWREKYIAEEDSQSPFHGRVYDEFTFTKKIYNYYIHPQWDDIGSSTLYVKILMADYEQGFAILEFIGEWNDAIGNDIMFLKREIADTLSLEGISKYILIAENVLNFHGSDDCYYEEWYQDICDDDGWIVLLNIQQQVEDEMMETGLHHYVNFGPHYNDFNWRRMQPKAVFKKVDTMRHLQTRALG